MADGDEKCGQHLVQVDGWAARLGLAPPRPRMPAPPPPPPLLAPPLLLAPTRWLGAVNVCAARAQGLHAGAPALRTSHTTCPASARRAHVRARPCAPTPAHLPHPPLAAHFARSQAGAARWTRHRLNSGAWGPPPRPPGRGVTSAGFVAHPTALAVAAGDVPVCCQVVV